MEVVYGILNCIGLIVIAIGIVCVYDARRLTKKFFSTSNANETARTIKIVGGIISIIGCIIVLM